MTETATPKTVNEWLEYQQRQHPTSIDLSLERPRAVLERLQLKKPAPLVISIAGTNGKGSTVALLRQMLQSLGYRVGSFTSPHILNYHERIALADRYVNDAELLSAFARIEAARGEITLTFFEYNTLAALLIFAESALDAVILEVGLGGRLDTVNLIDADAVILTTVELDHQAFLGATRGKIGTEKAGVFRAGQIAVYADRDPVPEVLEAAFARGTVLLRPTRDYLFHDRGDRSDRQKTHWRYQYKNAPEVELQKPSLLARCQLDNAAACLSLLLALQEHRRLPSAAAFTARELESALVRTHVHGRLSRIGEAPELYFDVAHNPQAARALADWLFMHPIKGRTLVVFGVLEDKDPIGIVTALQKHVHAWFLTGLEQESPRGLSAMELSARVRGATQRFGANCESYDTPAWAMRSARQNAHAEDRVLVLGSFFLIAAAYRAQGFTSLPFER